MTKEEVLIRKFYAAFERKDVATMMDCYGEAVVFNDPVFHNLDYKTTRQMWELVIPLGQNITIEIEKIEELKNRFVVVWRPSYQYYTGRKVAHRVQTVFNINHKKIIQHTDDFDFHNWSKQAFGIIGLLLGKTAFFKITIQRLAVNALNK